MLEHLIYLGTADGVLVMRRTPGQWEEVSVGLKGTDIRAIAHRPGHPQQVLAGSDENGLFYSVDAGQSWERRDNGLAYLRIRSVLFDPANPRQIFVGTEPAAIFRSVNDAENWEELTALKQLPGHEEWYLPYSPRAGAVRSLAAVPGLPGSFYAGIEQGGVAFTYDDGNTWQLLTGGVNEDVHDILVDANGGVTVFAATGRGVYRSFDGGKTWEQVLQDYTRALAEKPGHPQMVYAGPAQHVGDLGRIVQSHDEGSTWQPWWCGITVPIAGMVEHFYTRPGKLDDLGGLFAVLSSGEVWHSDLDTPDWVPVIACGSPKVNAIALAVG